LASAREYIKVNDRDIIKIMLVSILIDPVTLEGDLHVPDGATGIVVFVHGSGSSRKSPRNRFVSEVLNKTGFATLLFDLLTEDEDEVYQTRFNIPLLAERLRGATNWLKRQEETKKLAIGYFGASTGAAAAIIGAAELGEEIKAVVSRGGRPDLAGEALPKLKSPILLIVGGEDHEVIKLNEEAAGRIVCEKKIAIVAGATHLFEEPGTLEEAAELAADWFKKYLIKNK
jgi:putative phosphoribosyl transferase